jgi:hypothetical protein
LDHRNTIRVQIRIRVRVRVRLKDVLRNGNHDHGCGQDLYDHVIKFDQCFYMHCPQPYVWTMHVKARVELDNKIIQILLCRPVLSCCCLVVMTWFGNQCIFICLALSCLVLTLLCVTLLCRTITVGSSGRSIESEF